MQGRLSDNIFLTGSIIGRVSRVPVFGTGDFGVTSDRGHHLLLHRLIRLALSRRGGAWEEGTDCNLVGTSDRLADLVSLVALAPSEGRKTSYQLEAAAIIGEPQRRFI